MTRSNDRAAVERAYERIRAAIVEGRYTPGQRLVEQTVAEEFDLSRTPVREAIRRLDAEGLVVTERNRGAMVRAVSVDEVLDLYELRARLEAYAAELAAERMSDDELAELAAAVDSFGAVLAANPVTGLDDIRSLNDANRRIHSGIVEGAHHVRLGTMLSRAVDIPLVFQAFRSFERAELERSDLFHRLILEALQRRNGARAGRLMREHILQGLDAVIEGLPDWVDAYNGEA